MSFLVAVRPASAFSLKKPFFSSRVRARASLVVSLGTATLILSSLAAVEAASEDAAPDAAELAVEEEPPQAVRAAAALPWYHLGLLSPHRDSLTAAAFCNATTGRCNGRSRRRLSTLALRPRGSETIFSPLFPALFHRPGSLEGSMRKPTLLFTAIFVILHT